MTRAFVINQGLFQLSWPACVIGAAHGWLWTGLLVVGVMVLWQLNAANRHPLDIRMIMTCLLIGFTLDSTWIQLGLLEFAMPWPFAGLAPLWIMLLWLALALVINHSMSAFKHRLLMISVAGAIGSPLSYYAGMRFGAVEWVGPAWQVILAAGLSWAIVLPLLFRMSREPAASMPGRTIIQTSKSLS